jgi:hypothetical protein
MTGKYAVFTTPEDATVSLLHDTGASFQGVAGEVQGRPAHILTIDQDLPDGNGALLTVARKDFVTTSQRGKLWLSRVDGNGFAAFDVDDVRLTANPNRPLPRLVATRHYFVTATGERHTIIEASFFNGLARFLREGATAITPELQQLADLGFNTARTWTRFQLAQYGIGDCTLAEFPDLYQRIPDYVWCLARYGIYADFTAYTGKEDYDPWHWDQLTEACQPVPWAIASLVNENDQAGNHIDETQFQPKPWMRCSHGSHGGSAHVGVRPPWDWEELHTNGQSEEQRKIGHNAMECYTGAGEMAPGGKPVITSETSRCPEVGMWSGAGVDRCRALAFDAAAGAALLVAGACFHSVAGKKAGRLAGVELEAATAWAQGARSVPLRYQDGVYRRIDDPLYLRTYQRVLADGDAWTVRIRA